MSKPFFQIITCSNTPINNTLTLDKYHTFQLSILIFNVKNYDIWFVISRG